jgi:Luciferase-like monooxygenase
MTGFRVGVGSQVFNTRLSPTTLARAVYLAAVAAGVDSFWVADHLNSLVPRAIATPRYFGGAKLVPKIDAQLEPWTMLGRLAAGNRIGRLRLGVGVTDAGRRNPAVTAQAAATLHLLTGVARSSELVLGSGKAINHTALSGPNPLPGSKKRSPPSARSGTPTVTLSRASHPISRCTTPYSTFRPTGASGQTRWPSRPQPGCS